MRQHSLTGSLVSFAGGSTQTTLECERLVGTIGRSCLDSLSQFSDLCVDELHDKISPILGIQFGYSSVTSRNTGFATKETFRDLRCPALWCLCASMVCTIPSTHVCTRLTPSRPRAAPLDTPRCGAFTSMSSLHGTWYTIKQLQSVCSVFSVCFQLPTAALLSHFTAGQSYSPDMCRWMF